MTGVGLKVESSLAEPEETAAMADTWTVALRATLSQVTLDPCPPPETEITMLPATAQ